MAYPNIAAASSQTTNNKTYGALSPAVINALNAAHSPNTVRAYKADLTKFLDWGGELPSTPEQIASYMVVMVTEHHWKFSSIVRSLYAISHWHRAQHSSNPVVDELVKQVRRGLAKTHGQPPKQSEALELPHLIRVLDSIPDNCLTGLRDRALLTLGFFGAFRRSELVSLEFEQITTVPQGIEITLTRSKTNKFGALEVKPIVLAQNSSVCPITNLNKWLSAANIAEGPIFRAMTANNQLGHNSISSQTFYNILKQRIKQSGLTPDEFTPHSLRAGFITSAYKAGKDRYRIKQVSGHKSDSVLDMYIRDADRFTDCAGRLA